MVLLPVGTKGAEQIYGYSAKEILGKNVSILEPDSLKGEIKQLGEMIKQGKKIQNYETSRLRKDGTIIDVSMTLSPIFDTLESLLLFQLLPEILLNEARQKKP